MLSRFIYKNAQSIRVLVPHQVVPMNSRHLQLTSFNLQLPNNQQQKTTEQVMPPPPPPQVKVETPQVQRQLQQTTYKSSQPPEKQKSPKDELKGVTEEMDITAKTLGWIISGSAIAFISAVYGKIYLLFGAIPLFLYHSKDIDVISKTFNRDVQYLWRYSKCWFLSKKIHNEDLTLPKVFQQIARKHPDKIMLQMQDQNWKYKDVESYANRTTRLMQKYGFQKGNVVAMLTLNSPEMVAITIGLAKLGIVTALINTNLREGALKRAIKNSGCKGIVFDDELMHVFDKVYNSFDNIIIFQMRHKAKHPAFRILEEELLKECNDEPEIFINIHHHDPLLKLYHPNDLEYKNPMTISHEKFLFDSNSTAVMLDLKSTDKLYNPTPLHESTGMIFGIGPSITNCIPTVLRSKFSATDYFKECYIYNCTVGQYAGNMCKRLLLSKVNPVEVFHPVKVMFGTGLEYDYWQDFVNRFGTKMYEVYNPSKYGHNLINMEGKIGVIGFRPKLIPAFLFPHYVIKVFGKENIPIRDLQGHCQLCDYGEPGMLIQICNDRSAIPANTRYVTNVFKNGDIAITNGEILTIDDSLYLRPIKKTSNNDRSSRMISSEEVELLATKLSNKRCASYNVSSGLKLDIEILAVEDPDKTLDMTKFNEFLVNHLPENSLPQYIRVVEQLKIDGNLVDKQTLAEQGLNNNNSDIYYLDKELIYYRLLPSPLSFVEVSEVKKANDTVSNTFKRLGHTNEPKHQQPNSPNQSEKGQNTMKSIGLKSPIVKMTKSSERLKPMDPVKIIIENKPAKGEPLEVLNPLHKVLDFGNTLSPTVGVSPQAIDTNQKDTVSVGTSPINLIPSPSENFTTQSSTKLLQDQDIGFQHSHVNPQDLHEFLNDHPSVDSTTISNISLKSEPMPAVPTQEININVKGFPKLIVKLAESRLLVENTGDDKKGPPITEQTTSAPQTEQTTSPAQTEQTIAPELTEQTTTSPTKAAPRTASPAKTKKVAQLLLDQFEKADDEETKSKKEEEEDKMYKKMKRTKIIQKRDGDSDIVIEAQAPNKSNPNNVETVITAPVTQEKLAFPNRQKTEPVKGGSNSSTTDSVKSSPNPDPATKIS